MQDGVKVSGCLSVFLKDGSGRVLKSVEVSNLVVNGGRALIAARLAGVGTVPNPVSHMALGAGSTAASGTDTALEDELGRVALTSKTVNGNIITHEATVPAGVATGALNEAGLFNDASGGTLVARTRFPTINKTAGQEVTLVWRIIIG